MPSLTLFGQSLHLSSAAGTPGGKVSIRLSLTTPPGREAPSTCEWKIAIPVSQLAWSDQALEPGPAAKQAGKSIDCRVTVTTATTQTSDCLLYGGREPVQDGVIAVWQLRIRPDARPGSAHIRVDRGLAVLKDLDKFAMGPVQTTVTIRRSRK